MNTLLEYFSKSTSIGQTVLSGSHDVGICNLL